MITCVSVSMIIDHLCDCVYDYLCVCVYDHLCVCVHLFARYGNSQTR